MHHNNNSKLGECGFCKRNNEPEAIYQQHKLKDQFGRVVCPQLARHICELCGATGFEAHTRSYCPLSQSVRRANNAANKHCDRRLQATNCSAGRRVLLAQAPPAPTIQAPNVNSAASNCYSSQASVSETTTPSQSSSSPTNVSLAEVEAQRVYYQRPQSNAFKPGHDRMFRNMAKVTNSKYNSAGKLRNPKASSIPFSPDSSAALPHKQQQQHNVDTYNTTTQAAYTQQHMLDWRQLKPVELKCRRWPLPR